MRRFLSLVLLTTTLFSTADANARPKRQHDARWVGGLVLGITGTAGAVFTLNYLLLTHTCLASGGCADGQKPSSESSAWPYLGVAGGFAILGGVGWYLFATPNPPASQDDAIARGPARVALGVAPTAGGVRATLSLAF